MYGGRLFFAELLIRELIETQEPGWVTGSSDCCSDAHTTEPLELWNWSRKSDGVYLNLVLKLDLFVDSHLHVD